MYYFIFVCYIFLVVCCEQNIDRDSNKKKNCLCFYEKNNKKNIYNI